MFPIFEKGATVQMVSKRDGYLVLWPRYFDKGISRRRGRRVPEIFAVSSPKAVEIAYICRRIKLTPKLEKNVSHPSMPRKKIDRVVVRKPTLKGKEVSKQRLLKILGKRLSAWHSKVSEKNRAQQLKRFTVTLENV